MSAAEPTPLLQVNNIETFYGPIMAIRGISLDVHEGAMVAILGSNGAGKTTILKTISGIMQPQKGTIHFDGEDITGGDPGAIVRAGISHVPEGREVFPFLSVADNLRMGAFLRRDGNAVADDMEQAYDLFPALKQRINTEAGQLSGGEQQMLAIARALMMRPKLLLLDEPSLGLSPRLVKEIFAVIRQINETRKTTILLVEQNANMALHIAEFGYVLENGRAVLKGDTKTLLEDADIKEFYLGLSAHTALDEKRWKRRKQWG